MQVTETLNDGLKRGYEIVVTASELDAKVNEKLVEAQPEIEMKGFRKGKVPMAMLKKQFGQRLLGEAMQEAIDGAMGEHFEKSGDRPAMQPKVEMIDGENWKEGDDVKIAMSYEALPEIPEADMSGIELERMVVKADDAAIDEALNSLAERPKISPAAAKARRRKRAIRLCWILLAKLMARPLMVARPKITRWCWARTRSFRVSKISWLA